MTSTEPDFLTELDESAQGQDLYEASGSAQGLAQARDQAEAAGWLPLHVTDDWQSDEERAGIAVRRRRLYKSMKQLESAAARASGREDWVAVVSQANADLRDALHDHTAETEGDDGFLEYLVRQAPRLAADAALLQQEHRTLINDCARLTSLTRSSPPDIAAIRRTVLVVLGRLVEHRQRGAELLYDAFNVELGDGD